MSQDGNGQRLDILGNHVVPPLYQGIGPGCPVKGQAAAGTDAPFHFAVLPGGENQFDEIIHQMGMDVYRLRILHQV